MLLSTNGAWLRPYAAFCYLRDLFGSAEHTQWGLLGTAAPELIERLTSADAPHFEAIEFTFYVQWHLHLQLLAAAQHARRRRVALKGDLPIGVDKRSVDTWLAPRCFRMNTSTGAPPDGFDPGGQASRPAHSEAPNVHLHAHLPRLQPPFGGPALLLAPSWRDTSVLSADRPR